MANVYVDSKKKNLKNRICQIQMFIDMILIEYVQPDFNFLSTVAC